MEYIRNLGEYKCTAPSVVTLGKFDGVHRGHRLLMDTVLAAGRHGAKRTIVFTFDVSPQMKLGGVQTRSLMTNRERFLCLEQLGLDVLIECPFTEELRQMEAGDFVRDILLGLLHADQIVVGDDFHFGRGRAGDPAFLQALSGTLPFSVQVIGKQRDAHTGRDISSTWIREELLAGDIDTVNRLLGAPYFLLGEVVHGRQLGRTLQIPTINQIPEADKLLPPNGVYFSRTEIGSQVWNGITNIGTKPTVAGDRVTAETHLFDCHADLYGAEARVELLRFHRPERKFDSVEQLKDQMERDIRAARAWIS